MMSFRNQVAILRFKGPRFEDHGLDVDVLPEIIVYKRLLQETAKELWRRKHPDRQRLPKNFDDDVSLKFFELQPGSTGVPLVHEPFRAQLPQLFHPELDEAAELIEDTILAADEERGPPAKLPRIVLPLFQTFGDTLRDDEYLSVSTGVDKKRAARFDKRIKERILRWATKTYPDAIDLTGEVRSTDLDGRRFTLRLPDGRKVPGYFDPDHEAVVLEALGEHSSRRLRVIGTGEFAPEDGSLQQILSVERIELIGPEAAPPTVPIWERFASIAASVPDEAWREVPSDLSSQVDRYLYGRKDSR